LASCRAARFRFGHAKDSALLPMNWTIDHPFALFGVSLVVQWCAAYVGDLVRRHAWPVPSKERSDLDIVLTATLTLLALIIGFSFSMAVSRYDLRKNYEEAEANAIGTEYVRVDLLPPEAETKIRPLLKAYLDQRIAFYLATERHRIDQIASETVKAQNALWAAAVAAAAAEPTPVVALVVSGMNDVLNTQGYTQAAWWNRIPGPAWVLMGLIAVFSNLLLGYRERKTNFLVLLVLPMIISIAFFLIADIDSPNGGVIWVGPQNLNALSKTIEAH
jgi:hypothetical protein